MSAIANPAMSLPVDGDKAQDAGSKDFTESRKKMESLEGRMYGINFKPNASDVLVAGHPKCGTSWLQQIVQSLRSRGDMSFQEIGLAIPVIEFAYDHGTDLYLDQKWNPRVFKTHLWYQHTPKTFSRYIYIVRNPLDMAISYYHFLANWFFDPAEVSLEQFCRSYLMARHKPTSPTENASIWQHIIDWYPMHADPRCLWLHYEDLHADREGAVRLIAQHMGLANDEDLVQRVVEMSSFDFMKKNKDKFDLNHIKKHRNKECGLDEKAGNKDENPGRVRKGQTGEGKKLLPDNVRSDMEKRFKEECGEAIGFESYEAMRIGINKNLGRLNFIPKDA